MAMKEPRIYWGDLRLWRTARAVVAGDNRGGMQVYEGIDADDALVMPASPNFSTELECHTLFDPYPDASGDYTRVSFRSCIEAMVLALKARAETRHPLCYIDDVAVAATATTVSGTPTGTGPYTITTAVNPHGFAVGNVVLIRRLGSGLYTLRAVASTPAANTFTIASQDHSIASGDNILLVHQYWDQMVYAGKGNIGLNPDKNWFNDDAVYTFKGTCPAASRYSKLAINLDL